MGVWVGALHAEGTVNAKALRQDNACVYGKNGGHRARSRESKSRKGE